MRTVTPTLASRTGTTPDSSCALSSLTLGCRHSAHADERTGHTARSSHCTTQHKHTVPLTARRGVFRESLSCNMQHAQIRSCLCVVELDASATPHGRSQRLHLTASCYSPFSALFSSLALFSGILVAGVVGTATVSAAGGWAAGFAVAGDTSTGARHVRLLERLLET